VTPVKVVVIVGFCALKDCGKKVIAVTNKAVRAVNLNEKALCDV
jgi:hypothetical protein